MSEHTKKAAARQASNSPQKPVGGLGGENARGEPAGCPTGLADPEQARVTQLPGGGGTPGTRSADPSVPASPGEGVSEKQDKESSRGGAGS
jgi:hypothetical protein